MTTAELISTAQRTLLTIAVVLLTHVKDDFA
jgi:hypothetical protein